MKIPHKKMLLLAFLCWKAFSADSVSVGVTGNIVASPCIFNGGNSNLNVNLGDIQATNMVTPGSSSDPVAFNLLFTNWLNYYVYQITPYDLRHMNPTLD